MNATLLLGAIVILTYLTSFVASLLGGESSTASMLKTGFALGLL